MAERSREDEDEEDEVGGVVFSAAAAGSDVPLRREHYAPQSEVSALSWPQTKVFQAAA